MTSTCLKCGGHSFELVENSPIRSNFKFLFVQCTGCGGVVGVLDYFNVGSKVVGIEQTLKTLVGQVANAEQAAATAAHNVAVLAQRIKG